MASIQSLKAGIVIGSTRVTRIGPQIASFVRDAIQSPLARNSTNATQSQIQIDIIDIKDFNLPMFDEPGIPNRFISSEDYSNEHTRAWSRHISKFDAFVFLTSERNWGIPAELKNAIDYLFHEWKGKPAMIVSYGGQGGVHSAEQVKIVAGAIGMRVVDGMINMSFPSREFVGKGLAGESLGLDATDQNAPWSEHVPEISSIFWDHLVKEMLVSK
ncbi:NADPH-dependent FMN reductase [Penicillium chermesinum]|uniref:NADPH-dependent FMN reductase n=1 Tax=Penicillium chermesinum TaxID=63820 RepID=A0A9W9TG54_9EURO|nr:NADPH-dependent FMN reductase [Penicillium chermesinum]KAJ5220235.1 NADPH-dependent FMN reductase [Penicillium chermesinum]KAJ6157679.1 NADPH-dependent FMN reductase [Penicillium chermesinum]